MNSESYDQKEVIAPTTVVLNDTDIQGQPTRHQSIGQGNNSQERKHSDHSIMTAHLREELLHADDIVKPFQRHLKGKGWLRLKFTMVILAVLGSFIFVAGLPMVRDITCIYDQFLIYFSPFNLWLREHQTAAYYIKVFYVYSIDLSILVAFVHWVFFSNTWKLPMDFILFFLLRFICTNVISYRTPEDYIWPVMGYWSLADVTMDQLQYQVSGFTGSLVIVMIYWFREKLLIPCLVTVLFVVLSCTAELSFRTSYCTDLFAAVVIAHLSSLLNERWIDHFETGADRLLGRTWLRFTHQDKQQID